LRISAPASRATAFRITKSFVASHWSLFVATAGFPVANTFASVLFSSVYRVLQQLHGTLPPAARFNAISIFEINCLSSLLWRRSSVPGLRFAYDLKSSIFCGYLTIAYKATKNTARKNARTTAFTRWY